MKLLTYFTLMPLQIMFSMENRKIYTVKKYLQDLLTFFFFCQINLNNSFSSAYLLF